MVHGHMVFKTVVANMREQTFQLWYFHHGPTAHCIQLVTDRAPFANISPDLPVKSSEEAEIGQWPRLHPAMNCATGILTPHRCPDNISGAHG